MNQEQNSPTIEEMNNQSDRRVGEVFRTMLIFSVVMVLAPLSTYFYTKNYLFEGKLLLLVGLIYTVYKLLVFKGYFPQQQVYIYSVMCTVLVIHVILGAYIYLAWKVNTIFNPYFSF